MFICNKKQIIASQGEKFFQQNKDWLNDCLNKEVVFPDKHSEWGVSKGTYYNIRKTWCIEKNDNT